MMERALIYQKAFERLEEEDNLNVIVVVREDEVGVDNANDIGLEVDGPSDIMESGIGQGKGRGKQAILSTPSSYDWDVVELGMNKKYDKYWGNFGKINPLLLYANVFHSRYKFVYVRWSLDKFNDKGEVESKVVEMKDGMKMHFNWYEKRSIDEGQAPNVIESSRNKDEKGKRGVKSMAELVLLWQISS
ncbi:hypothetical protein Vadar_006555 [Vaccinium darrowii]|uniref:Uncharacterized protein n=1 Tax=Vaccinium darrowii TaxID=229202 RepID=A0ACB7Y6M6_9ERIC|nr:hypothetical protein Vadar_006555 [Vaccinium darrowii]